MTYIAYLHCRALKQLGVVATLCSLSLSKGVRWSFFKYIIFTFTFHNIIYFLHYPHHFHFLHIHACIFRPSPRMWQIFHPHCLLTNFKLWHLIVSFTIFTCVLFCNNLHGGGGFEWKLREWYCMWLLRCEREIGQGWSFDGDGGAKEGLMLDLSLSLPLSTNSVALGPITNSTIPQSLVVILMSWV